MHLLILLVVACLANLPSGATAGESAYFRLGYIQNPTTASVTPPADTTPMPPDMTNGFPPPQSPLPPGMGGDPGIPTPTVPHTGLLKVAALPGWSWSVMWDGMPANLDQVQVYPRGFGTVFELTVRLGNSGCALATLGVIASTGQVNFSTFRDDSNGACLTPTTGDWSSITGQAFPSSVKIVETGPLPGGEGYIDTSASFAVAY
ncbi:hypothetical protein [Methylobacterium radiotolerans]|uniref:hypothetical protein n=1 Tax=Methylobacterium radiotolerans TaxID=31998 RepID=UPI001F172EB5|nr:hypothetical protein [Methylobacterium radiotolerans]UIY45809.1 hypothetical protein LZ599_32400 [Methylobacterium radiotolerans]